MWLISACRTLTRGQAHFWVSLTTDGHEWTQIPGSVLLIEPSFPSRPSREIIPEQCLAKEIKDAKGIRRAAAPCFLSKVLLCSETGAAVGDPPLQ
jgi:hypothetical protein